MKIKKQTKGTSAVKATTLGPSNQTDFVNLDTVANGTCPYSSAKCYIENAIKALSEVAEQDIVAKESIANLAVVLLDLSSC